MAPTNLALGLIQAILSWPVAIVVLAVVFRREVRGLLSAGVQRLKVGPLEVEWTRQAVRVESQVGLPPPTPTTSRRMRSELAAFEDLKPLASSKTNRAVSETYDRLESIVRDRLRSRLPDAAEDIHDARNLAMLAGYAKYRNLISDRTYEALEGITVLRNLADHGAEPDADKALEYVALAEAALFAFLHDLGSVTTTEAGTVTQVDPEGGPC